MSLLHLLHGRRIAKESSYESQQILPDVGDATSILSSPLNDVESVTRLRCASETITKSGTLQKLGAWRKNWKTVSF